ncbi:hypothetical protein MD484_g7540, partial [Candolleomyces efflorescens]
MSTSKSGATTATPGARRPHEQYAKTAAATFMTPPPLIVGTTSPWAIARYYRHMDLEIYKKYKDIFHKNDLTQEKDAPNATGPSAKFHACAVWLYSKHIGPKEREELSHTADFLMRLDLQKIDPLRHPDYEVLKARLEKIGSPDWLEELFLREVTSIETLERNPELANMGSVVARDQMIRGQLRF